MTKKIQDSPEYSLGFLLTKVGRIATKMYADRLEDIGLTPLQAGILASLSAEDGRSQKDLMAALHVDKGTIHQMLKALEQKKFITMKTAQEDRRHLSIHLSKAGAATLPAIGKIDEEVSATLNSLVSSQLRKPLMLALLEAFEASEN